MNYKHYIEYRVYLIPILESLFSRQKSSSFTFYQLEQYYHFLEKTESLCEDIYLRTFEYYLKHTKNNRYVKLISYEEFSRNIKINEFLNNG